MISNSDEDYAEAMVKWIKEIVNPSPPGLRRTVTRNQISYQ
jgi:hypothetical protein